MKYIIDWDKVKTIDDIKKVLDTLGIVYEDWSPNLSIVKHLVKELDIDQSNQLTRIQ